ncbi:MAG TPA: biotin transporter BioY [Candidatus Avamphibacillus intestinigallinarum]|nr:biotin transporter BioY [Candidatus Avamphibacillus intestinigallinarum]
MIEQRTKLREVIICGLFVALTAILAQVSIPVPPVPFTGQTLAVGITATILGSRLSTFSMVGYLALGAAGVPIFSNFTGGLGILVGPTGGFITGFIFTAFITGYILEKTRFTIPLAIVANLIGMFVTLAFGWVQLKFVADLSWTGALAAGVTPFIPLGIVKAILASWLGIVVRHRLMSAGVLPIQKTKATDVPQSEVV